MAAIPSVTPEHVLAAISQIDREGVPKRRQATKFHLTVGERSYPPKLVLSVAAGIATGKPLEPNDFSGGEETNRILRALGFTIVGGTEGRRGPDNSNGQQTATSDGAAYGIARVVLRGRPSGTAKDAADTLLEAFDRWESDRQARFTITPGGFVADQFPKDWGGGMGWESHADALQSLSSAALPALRRVLTPKVLSAAQARTKILTIGIDLMESPADPETIILAEHAELVAVVETSTGNVLQWTGKSYPVPAQQRTLVHIVDLRSHLLEYEGERVLILGCHDLNMFSARARANQTKGGLRDQRCEKMERLVRGFRPTVVLQHPHSTDTPNIWNMPWACLRRSHPSVQTWASGIGHYAWRGRPRRKLGDVLGATRSEDVHDVVVRAR